MKRLIAGNVMLLALAAAATLAAGMAGGAGRALLDLWHTPIAGEPPGHTMREPLHPTQLEFPVSIWLGSLTAEPPELAWLHYREWHQADWQTAAMMPDVVQPDVQYWLAAIPGPYSVDSVVVYYLEAAAAGADTTFVYGTDGESSSTADEEQARLGAFTFQVLGPGTPTPPPSTPTPLPTATGTPGPSATPAPSPTGTPGGDLGCNLELNDILFTAGDHFLLEMEVWNHTPVDTRIAQFVILDVFGQFWFWPTWSVEPDFRLGTLGGGQTFTDTILDFYWPTGAGSAQGIRVWGALLDESLEHLLGELAHVEFSFQ